MTEDKTLFDVLREDRIEREKEKLKRIEIRKKLAESQVKPIPKTITLEDPDSGEVIEYESIETIGINPTRRTTTYYPESKKYKNPSAYSDDQLKRVKKSLGVSVDDYVYFVSVASESHKTIQALNVHKAERCIAEEWVETHKRLKKRKDSFDIIELLVARAIQIEDICSESQYYYVKIKDRRYKIGDVLEELPEGMSFIEYFTAMEKEQGDI